MAGGRRLSIPRLTQLVVLLAFACSTVAQLDVNDFSSSSPSSPDFASLANNLQRGRSEDMNHLLRRNNAVQELSCALGVTSDCNAPATSVDTNFDPLNCGAIGPACPSVILNSAGPVLCSQGACVSGCRLGYAWSSRAGACINVASDPANCGSVGNICLVPTGTASVSCQAGICVASGCLSGYKLSNGTCAAVPFASDPLNCGRAGNRCPASFANGVGSICVNGACMPERCAAGYVWNANATTCVLATSTFATPLPTSATSSSTPQTTSTSAPRVSPPSDTLSAHSSTSTATTVPSQAKHTTSAASASTPSRQRRASLIARSPSLCPPGLTACPIPHAASFDVFQASNFTSFRSFAASSPSLDGGFECIDTQYESCGGCTSVGDGRNCGEGIAHARGTGCHEGRCVVFSCEKGWKPDKDAKRCVRLWEGGRKKSSRRGKGRRRLH